MRYQAEEESSRYYGKYRGKVTDNEDPSNLGRLKAKVPEILGEVDTSWALPAFPYSANGEGMFMVPPAGAGVWIEFEAGKVSKPIWSGCWYGEDERPANETGDKAKPALKIIRSGKGLLVALDDDAKTLTLSDGDGNNLIVIKASGGQIRIEAKTKVTLEAPQIELVDGAAHPVVFGDLLNQYLQQLAITFNTHVHAPLPSPPAVPVTPPTPALLSMKVKTG